MRTSWGRISGLRVAETNPLQIPFDTTQAVVISSSDELLSLNPPFLKGLSAELDVDGLAGRLCPVLLGDHSVAILALAEHVGSDQADELMRRVLQRGYVLATPQRYVLAAPLLLAIARKQVTAQTLVAQGGVLREQSKTALADAFQDMVEWGVRHGASDLHLNVRLHEAESEVKYTLAGCYVAPERFRRIPTTTLMDMLSVAWMDIGGGNGAVFDPLIEQQGQMIRQVDGRAVMLRWASLAADQGPSVCLRLLGRDAAAACSSLAQLGYLPHQIEVIERAMLSEGGAIVFAGTVGSGKSTTLASLISGIPEDRKVITIEDPVEYLIPRAIQNTVTRDLGATAHDGYAAKLRTLKRSAMSDVLLGEIRDQETGRAFMDLAGSGVNVYTTTHAPSAAQIGERLASDFIGISRDFLATPGVLKLLVYQVLLSKLCVHCALPASELLRGAKTFDGHGRTTLQWRAWFERLQRLFACDGKSFRIRNPAGCPECQNKQIPRLNGYAGRTVAAEYIEPALSAGFLESIQNRTSLEHWHAGSSAGLMVAANDSGAPQTAMQCAIYKAMRGEIDPREIEPRFQSFDTLERLLRARRDQRLRVPA
ncbi:MAG TPA: ATPase, T2SS/T4P/T4SS family [Eoetvoesiella sp.]